MIHPRSVPLLLAAGAALALSACGDAAPAGDAASLDTTEETTNEPGTAAPTPDTSGDPPTELVVEQLAPPLDEAAAEAAVGDVVAVHYTGRAWSTGQVFDSSLERSPFTFQLGAGMVIQGWDEGIVGLQVGEQARLIIPPDLAYGEAGVAPDIGANETLVFDVELVDIVQPGGASSTPESTEG